MPDDRQAELAEIPVAVEIDHDYVTIPNRYGGTATFLLGDTWWDYEELALTIGSGDDNIERLLEYELLQHEEDVSDFDLEALTPVLERALQEAFPQHEELAAWKAQRAGLPLGTLMSVLRRQPQDEQDVLVPKLLRRGSVTLISGREKRAGKSTLVFNLIGALERNEETVFGPAYGRPVKTLIVTEEPDFSLIEKGDDFDLKKTDVIKVSEWVAAAKSEGIDLSSFEAVLAAVEQIAIELKYELVVIDPLSRIARVKDESGMEMSANVEEASLLAQRANLAVLLVHHDNKSDDRAVEDKMRGSTSTAAAADQIVHVERKRPKQAPRERDLEAWGRVRGSEWEMVSRLNEDSRGYTVVEGKDATTKSGLQALHKQLTEVGRCTAKMFAQRLKLDDTPAGVKAARQLVQRSAHESTRRKAIRRAPGRA